MKKNKRTQINPPPYLKFLTLIGLAFLLFGCSSSAPQIDLTEKFGAKPEVEQLRYFREIKMANVRDDYGLTGLGTRITIMGEIADSNHPDIRDKIIKQYNTFSKKGEVLTGKGNQPYAYEKFGLNDGHGTHIAGTIAAACDEIGVQGVACGATLDVYDLGAHENEEIPVEGWGDNHPYATFLSAFTYALRDVTNRDESKITTGSFNLESPLIKYNADDPMHGKSVTEILKIFETGFDDVDDLIEKNLIHPADKNDLAYLKRMYENNGEDPYIIGGTLLALSKEWKDMVDAVVGYQKSGGVYLVTESNNNFEHRTSLLNALPELNDNIDKDLWLSIVLAVPEKLDELAENATEDDITALMDGGYSTPINSCGSAASDYCILVPSYWVLSTMTEKIKYPNEPMYVLDGRKYQILTGHSMGAPMVAGVLALMEEYNRRENRGYTIKELVRILKENANRSFEGYDSKKHGRGLLDVEAALKAM